MITKIPRSLIFMAGLIITGTSNAATIYVNFSSDNGYGSVNYVFTTESYNVVIDQIERTQWRATLESATISFLGNNYYYDSTNADLSFGQAGNGGEETAFVIAVDGSGFDASIPVYDANNEFIYFPADTILSRVQFDGGFGISSTTGYAYFDDYFNPPGPGGTNLYTGANFTFDRSNLVREADPDQLYGLLRMDHVQVVTTVPVPGALYLFISGILGLFGFKFRNCRQGMNY